MFELLVEQSALARASPNKGEGRGVKGGGVVGPPPPQQCYQLTSALLPNKQRTQSKVNSDYAVRQTELYSGLR